MRRLGRCLVCGQRQQLRLPGNAGGLRQAWGRPMLADRAQATDDVITPWLKRGISSHRRCPIQGADGQSRIGVARCVDIDVGRMRFTAASPTRKPSQPHSVARAAADQHTERSAPALSAAGHARLALALAPARTAQPTAHSPRQMKCSSPEYCKLHTITARAIRPAVITTAPAPPLPRAPAMAAF